MELDGVGGRGMRKGFRQWTSLSQPGFWIWESLFQTGFRVLSHHLSIVIKIGVKFDWFIYTFRGLLVKLVPSVLDSLYKIASLLLNLYNLMTWSPQLESLVNLLAFGLSASWSVPPWLLWLGSWQSGHWGSALLNVSIFNWWNVYNYVLTLWPRGSQISANFIGSIL